MPQLFKNNAASTLAAALTTGGTTLTVSTGHGDRFPVVSGSDWCAITLTNAAGDIEIVRVTARATGSDSMTIVRAQEGTAARAWQIGDIVSLRLTAGGLTQLQTDIDAAFSTATTASNTINTHVAASDPHPQYLTSTEGNAAYQPLNARLTTLSGVSAQQATDLAALSTFMGTVLDDASQGAALATLGALVNGVAAKTGAYTVVASDRGKLIDATGTWTLSLTAAATLGAGFAFAVRNSGTGTITIDPNSSELIDGAATVALAAGESCVCVCDGAAWKTVGRTQQGYGRLYNIVRYTTAGSGTYNKPSNINRLLIRAIGGGGGGRGGDSTNYGTGGGGGAYSESFITAPASSYAYTVGAPGSGGAPNSNGSNGGATTIAGMSAGGGLYTGAGGTATGGNFNVSGASANNYVGGQGPIFTGWSPGYGGSGGPPGLSGSAGNSGYIEIWEFE
jgi:hypothetical protein